MPTDVIMPQMGESIVEGTITKWLKKSGDRVEKDEPLFEISTDKVDAEIPSPAAGVLTAIHFAEGVTVGINTVVGVIAAEGEVTVAPLKTEFSGAEPASGISVVMPQMGESIFEGTITKWLKKPSDRVEKDEPLFEISTDKVDAEIPAPASGILQQILVPEGTTVQINAVVGMIGGSGVAVRISTPEKQTGDPQVSSAPVEISSEVPVPAQEVRSSPLVRRIARENKVDLALVTGSGSNGRITKDDVLQYLASPKPKAAIYQAPSSTGSQALTLPGDLVPMTKMRTIIGQRMVESLQKSPHAHTVYKIDMTRIARLREREKTNFEKQTGVKLTYMPFIAAAAVDALRKVPIVNASIEGGSIRFHQNIHLGIAVALEWGLIVPVIRQAEQRSFVELSRAIADLAGRARTKKLMPDETSGSTFTLTNSGAFGGEFGMPIINQPESAILAVGGLRKEPVVLSDAEGNDTIAIRSVQLYCLGFDHRTIDGADSGKFMLEFKLSLETWDRKLI